MVKQKALNYESDYVRCYRIWRRCSLPRARKTFLEQAEGKRVWEEDLERPQLVEDLRIYNYRLHLRCSNAARALWQDSSLFRSRSFWILERNEETCDWSVCFCACDVNRIFLDSKLNWRKKTCWWCCWYRKQVRENPYSQLADLACSEPHQFRLSPNTVLSALRECCKPGFQRLSQLHPQYLHWQIKVGLIKF